MTWSSTHLRILAGAACFSVLGAWASERYLDDSIEGGIEAPLSQVLGQQLHVGGIDVALTGTLALRNLELGDLFRADSIEASLGYGELLRGRVFAEELIVKNPSMTVTVIGGTSNLEAVLDRVRRVRAARKTAVRPAADKADKADKSGASLVKRVRVLGGALVASLQGMGEVSLRNVEVRSLNTGPRLLAGPVEFDISRGPWDAVGRFSSAGLDLSGVSPSRFTLVGGEVHIGADGYGQHAIGELLVSRPDRKSPVAVSGRFKGRSGDFQVHIQGAHFQGTASAVPLEILAPLAPEWVDLRKAVWSGGIKATQTRYSGGNKRFAIGLEGSVNGLFLNHRRLASTPVDVDAKVDTQLSFGRRGDKQWLQLESLRVKRGNVGATASGSISVTPEGVEAVSAKVVVDDSPCGELLKAVPEAMRGTLAGIEVSGKSGGKIGVRFSRQQPADSELQWSGDLSTCKVRKEPALANPRDTSAGRLAEIRKSDQYMTIKAMPKVVPSAFRLTEDGRFFRHDGFDLGQIRRSFTTDLVHSKILRGGSTITQQLAKNLFLGPERTLSRKFQEAILAWRLEAVLNKWDILERYLNIIEFGPGVYGIGAAAEFWFHKEASKLLPHEAAFLAGITREPTSACGRIREAGKLDEKTAERVQSVLASLLKNNRLSKQDYQRALVADLGLKGCAVRP